MLSTAYSCQGECHLCHPQRGLLKDCILSLILGTKNTPYPFLVCALRITIDTTAHPAGAAPLPWHNPWNLTSMLLPGDFFGSPYAVLIKYFISSVITNIDCTASSSTPKDWNTNSAIDHCVTGTFSHMELLEDMNRRSLSFHFSWSLCLTPWTASWNGMKDEGMPINLIYLAFQLFYIVQWSSVLNDECWKWTE